jgi:hypothetical protein
MYVEAFALRMAEVDRFLLPNRLQRFILDAHKARHHRPFGTPNAGLNKPPLSESGRRTSRDSCLYSPHPLAWYGDSKHKFAGRYS